LSENIDRPITRCPQCGTMFRVSLEQLQAAAGKVKCGSCLHPFEALDFLVSSSLLRPLPPPLNISDKIAQLSNNQSKNTSDAKADLIPQPNSIQQTAIEQSPTPEADEEGWLDILDEELETGLAENHFSELDDEELEASIERALLDIETLDDNSSSAIEEHMVSGTNLSSNRAPEHEQTNRIEPTLEDTQESFIFEEDFSADILEPSIQDINLETKDAVQDPTFSEAEYSPDITPDILEDNTLQDVDVDVDDVVKIPLAADENEIIHQLDMSTSINQRANLSEKTDPLLEPLNNEEEVVTSLPLSDEELQQAIAKIYQEAQSIKNPEHLAEEFHSPFEEESSAFEILNREDEDEDDKNQENDKERTSVHHDTATKITKTKDPDNFESFLNGDKPDIFEIEDLAKDQPFMSISHRELLEEEWDHLEETDSLTQEKKPLQSLVFKFSLGFLMLLLGFQVILYNWSLWSQQPKHRPWMVTVCHLIGCQLNPLRDVDNINIMQSALIPTATNSDPKRWHLELMLENKAELQQPFPTIKLKIMGISGETLAERLLTAEDYLSSSFSKSNMPVNTPIHVALDLDIAVSNVKGHELILL